MRAPAPAPAPANAYAAPPSESGEPTGAAGEVVALGFIVRVHCGLPSRGTPVHPLLAPLQPFPAALVYTSSQSRVCLPWFRPGQRLHCSQDVLPLQRAGSCPQIVSPGMLGEEGKGDLGRKPGRSNDTSRFFFFFKPLLL